MTPAAVALLLSLMLPAPVTPDDMMADCIAQHTGNEDTDE
jgi:hypothetical protein